MKKIFTLFSLLFLFAVGTWADEVTIDFSTKGYDNAQEISSVEQDGITLTFDKGTGNNTPKYYNTGTAIRTYGGNTISVSSSKVIEKIVFTFSSGEGTNAITASTGTFTTNTWEGNTSDLTFTIGGTTGHRRIKQMVFTVSSGGDTRTPTTIEFSGDYKTKFTYGADGESVTLPTATVMAGTTAVSGATVTWTAEKVSGNDKLIPTISGNKVNIPNQSWGKVKVTASYAGNTTYRESTKNYTIDVYKGRMSITEILDDFQSQVISGGQDWSSGIPTSYWCIGEEGGDIAFFTATVTYANGAYTYIQDEDGKNLLLYKGGGLGYAQGDVITGQQSDYSPGAMYGNLKTYNGLLELEVTENNFTKAGSGTTVTPKTIYPDVLGDLENMNAYLQIEGAVYIEDAGSKNYTFEVGGTQFTVRQNWTNVSVEGLTVGAVYTLKGMGAVYNTTPQLYLTEYTKTADTTGIDTINSENNNVNAPMYNLAGQQVTKNYKGVVIQNGKKQINK